MIEIFLPKQPWKWLRNKINHRSCMNNQLLNELLSALISIDHYQSLQSTPSNSFEVLHSIWRNEAHATQQMMLNKRFDIKDTWKMTSEFHRCSTTRGKGVFNHEFNENRIISHSNGNGHTNLGISNVPYTMQ